MKRRNAVLARVLDNLYTTVGGMVLGAVTGGAMVVHGGQFTKEAVLAGAAVGAAGALLKDPKRIRRRPRKVEG